jgi:NAD(P)-dependent dehydrogenase (short-subunit alcohol dehydrogenase family)
MRTLLLTILVICSLPAFSADPGAKTALITGTNRGIGLGLAREFAAQGWNVIATARDPAAAYELQQLAKEYDTITIEQLDVTDHKRIDELAAKYKDRPIDVLLNNAAYIKSYRVSLAPFDQIDINDTRQSFEVNVIGPMKLAQAFLPQISASQEKKIINTSSGAASFSRPSMGSSYNYITSKTALNMFTYTLAAGLKNQGIIVAAVHPGVVETNRPGDDQSTMPPAMRNIQRIEVKESAARLFALISGLTPDKSGKFLNYADGAVIPW